MRHLRILLPIAVLVGACLTLGSALWGQTGTTGACPPANTTTGTTPVPLATSQITNMNGMEVGEVLLNGNVVLRLHAASGGYTAGQRAAVVASRMQNALNQGYSWNDVTVGNVNNEVALLMGNSLLVTVDPGEANFNRSSRLNLANAWRNNTIAAIRGVPIATVPSTPPGTTVTTLPGTTTVGTTTTTGTVTAVAGTVETFPAWTNPATKIVPIIAVGTPGVSLGAAQVTGPSELVDQVRSVLEVDAEFQRVARIRAFVPSNTLTGLNRVQGVAVSALLNYRLVSF